MEEYKDKFYESLKNQEEVKDCKFSNINNISNVSVEPIVNYI